MMWMWAGRYGWRSRSWRTSPAGPAKGLDQYKIGIVETAKRISERPLTIVRHRVRDRPQAVQAVIAILIRCELATQVKVCLVWILLLVQTVCAALPNVYRDALDRLSRRSIRHHAVHKGHLAIRRHGLDYARVIGRRRGVLAEKGAQDGRLGSLVAGADQLLACDFVDQPLLDRLAQHSRDGLGKYSRLQPQHVAH